MKNVSTGGKGSDVVRKVKIHLVGVDAPGATCDPGENSGPVQVNLRMVDDDGDVLVDSAKIAVCYAGEGLNMEREVFFQSPLNCAGSAVPTRQTEAGVITATASATGQPDYVENHQGRCTR